MLFSLLYIFIFTSIACYSNYGECSKTEPVYSFNDCKGKKPFDESNDMCCFMKFKYNDRILQGCYEFRKIDIINNAVEDTIIKVQESKYEPWDDKGEDGLNGNLPGNTIISLKCDECNLLNISYLLIGLIIIISL